MKYIIANLKMNPEKREDMEGWMKQFRAAAVERDGTHVIACPPFIWLPLVASHNTVAVGAQDVFWEQKGPYTGEVSPSMLRSVGCDYVIVGHSERRALGETNEIIRKKIKAALQAGLKVILAVGESARANERGTLEREIGPAVEEQLAGALSGISRTKLGNLLIAYEPLWAVGSGTADTPEDALKAALFIRKCVSKITGAHARAQEVPVLYGGSVTSKNAASFLEEEALQGVLVGNASLDAREFLKIVEAGSNHSY